MYNYETKKDRNTRKFIKNDIYELILKSTCTMSLSALEEDFSATPVILACICSMEEAIKRAGN